MQFKEGDHVRFDCAGPYHLQGTGRVEWVGPVLFKDGHQHTIYVIKGDDNIQGTDEPRFMVGDGEIAEVLPD